MLIGIDASRAFTEKRTGVENYSYHLIQALANLKCQHQFCLYLKPNQSIGDLANQVEVRQIKWPYLWSQAGLALETWLNPPNLLFIPAHVIPFLKNPRIPVVVTVHDLHLDFLPQQESVIQKFYLNRWTEMMRAKLAAHIIAVSESTKRDLVEKLSIKPEKITVVYEGVSRRFAPKLKTQNSLACHRCARPQRLRLAKSGVAQALAGGKLKSVLDKYKIATPYLLFVGTIQPRKNLARLIEAFSTLNPRPSTLELVLAGQRGWMADEIYTAPQKFGVGERVKFINYVEDDDLPYLYAGAYAFLMPSLHEGFGLPVLEAMACGTPVVISRTSSLPEVGGSAAVYVDPKSVESISKGILQVLNWDEKTYQQKSQECIAQAQKFSWEKCAQQTLKVFEKVLRGT